MKKLIKGLIFLIFIFWSNPCLSEETQIDSWKFKWDDNKDEVTKGKEIISREGEEGVIESVSIPENLYNKEAVVTYTFDKGKLVEVEVSFSKFANNDERRELEDKIVRLISAGYNPISSLEDMYANYKVALGSSGFRDYIKGLTAKKWEKLYGNDTTNILYKDNMPDSEAMTIRAEKKDWLTRNLGGEVTPSGWLVVQKESKLDNNKSIYIKKWSSNTLPNNLGKQENGYLIIRCSDNKTEVLVHYPEYIGINNTEVRYKIDDNKINKENWIASTGGDSVFSKKPIKLLKSMAGGKSFIIQLDTYKNGAQELEFDIAGIDENIDKIAEYCKWQKR